MMRWDGRSDLKKCQRHLEEEVHSKETDMLAKQDVNS